MVAVQKEEVIYVHSKCCGAHWELLVVDGIWKLECEKCGMPVGSSVSVIGPTMNNCQCEECKKEIGDDK